MSIDKVGFVALIGAGPGAADLITLRGLRHLQKASIVFYDHLTDSSLLKECEDAELVFVGKIPDGPRVRQIEINRLLVKAAKQGHHVVRLKGGDPFVFGRGGEEVLALRQENVSYEIVPGVSSSIAAPSAAEIPVTHRGIAKSVSIITARDAKGSVSIESKEQWKKLAQGGGTLVFLMGVRVLNDIVTTLQDAGLNKSTPVAIVQAASTDNEKRIISTLGSIENRAKEERIASPATIIVGEVAALGKEIAHQQIQELSLEEGRHVSL